MLAENETQDAGSDPQHDQGDRELAGEMHAELAARRHRRLRQRGVCLLLRLLLALGWQCLVQRRERRLQRRLGFEIGRAAAGCRLGDAALHLLEGRVDLVCASAEHLDLGHDYAG